MNNGKSSRAAGVRLYFLGSGRLGLPVLAALQRDQRVSLVGLGTQPDRGQGRGRRLRATPVGEWAKGVGLAADKPRSVNADEFLHGLRALAPELLVVASFGQLLQRPLLDLPDCGCLNIHASLLPRHRGAAPINAAILTGDCVTGISFMRMDEGLDTGPVYEQWPCQLTGRETAPELETALAELAAAHAADCIWRIGRSGLQARPQKGTPSSAAKLTSADGQLDWREPALDLARRVRGLQPWPRAWFVLEHAGRRRRMQITGAAVSARLHTDREPGEILQADKDGWIIACGHGSCLELNRVIPDGRREMSAADFLRGSHLSSGLRLAENAKQGSGVKAS